MSKEKSAAEKKQSVSNKATKENKENISQAKEDAKKLATVSKTLSSNSFGF